MSSKRAIRRRACDGKQRHPTAERAWAHITSLARSGLAKGTLNAYRCRFCRGWHVGHWIRKED